MLMKNFKILVICFLTISCFEEKQYCKLFKEGNFSAEIVVEDKTYKSTFTRNKNIQIENFNNKIDTFSIRWINDCEYIIKNIKPKNRLEEKPIHIKILTNTNNSYTFEYSYVGESKKNKGKATKK